MQYSPRVLDLVDRNQIIKEFQTVGVDPVGIDIMLPKAQFRIVKLKSIPVVAANIIKQDMLSKGGEVVTSRGTINQSVPTTDLLILGTKKQFKHLVESIRSQQFKLPEIAREIDDVLSNFDFVPPALQVGHLHLEFGKRTYIMGILNVTPDSFSDGGKFTTPDQAVRHALKMIDDGADIIDIGGESTRPGAEPISAEEELKRIIPVIEDIVRTVNTVISVDTQKAKVAEAALKAGAKIINDISGLRADPKMAEIAAKFEVPVVVMHMQGKPCDMQVNPQYQDLIAEIVDYLEKSVKIACEAGVAEHKIIIDPGIGFGKTVEDNLQILQRLKEFKSLGKPILVGTSRKSLIGKVLGLPVENRIEGTAATVALAISRGADIVRVHDVAEMSQVVRMSDAIERSDLI